MLLHAKYPMKMSRRSFLTATGTSAAALPWRMSGFAAEGGEPALRRREAGRGPTRERKPDLVAAYDGVVERAVEIAKTDIRGCMGKNRCGCRGVPPAGRGYEDGVWLADAVWTFNDGILYFVGPQDATDYLYAETPGAMGVIPFFAGFQEREGPHSGNIPIAKYLPGGHAYELDYGGMFDLTYRPRKNHRDDVFFAALFFVDAIYRHWKLFNTTQHIKKYFPVLQRHQAYWTNGLDAETGLFRSTHGLGDVSIDKALPRSCALVTTNAACMQMFAHHAEMARAIGRHDEADKYESLAARLRKAINRHLWNDATKRYEVKIFTNITTNKNSAMYEVKEDHHFFVAGNMWLMYCGIPDALAKVKALMEEIEKADGALKLYGQYVEPPYTDGSYSAIFDGGRYFNGDVWPCFASLYSIALFRVGYPKQALEILKRQAAVAIRDGGFYEYYEDDAEGRGKGAFHYGFTAAPYLRGVVEGLFGLHADYSRGTVFIHPSVDRSGSLRCQLGLHPFELTVDVQEEATRLSVTTTYAGSADFRVRIGRAATACRALKPSGAEVPCTVRKVGEATYALFYEALRPGTTVFQLLPRQ